MSNKNYNPCTGCGGEDCICCQVYLERQADNRAALDHDPADDFDDFDRDQDFENDDEDEENDCDDSMDGDHESALTSAGFGLDESYESDTPLGDFYDDMGGCEDY